MYLFTREATLVGGLRRPLEYALDIIEIVNDTLNSNAEYIGSIDGHGELFVPASGQRALFTRLA